MALNSTYILVIKMIKVLKRQRKGHPLHLHEAPRRALRCQILKIIYVNLFGREWGE